MIIPHTAINPDTLRNVIIEYVSREGTEYGPTDFSLDSKIAAVMKQIEDRKVVIVFDEETETCDLVSTGSERYRKLGAN